eukprot:scaffold129425_cov18-Tisochrysis_lutea.AAC.1
MARSLARALRLLLAQLKLLKLDAANARFAGLARQMQVCVCRGLPAWLTRCRYRPCCKLSTENQVTRNQFKSCGLHPAALARQMRV